MEVCNAYTELNDPAEQARRFTSQSDYHVSLGSVHGRDARLTGIGAPKSKETEESEAAYVRALEYGLPPTGGWGMGIDRVVMLLSGKTSIRVRCVSPWSALMWLGRARLPNTAA